MELGTWCWLRVVLIEKRPLTECERSSMNRAARSVGAREQTRDLHGQPLAVAPSIAGISDLGKGRFCCDHEARFREGFSIRLLNRPRCSAIATATRHAAARARLDHTLPGAS